MYEEMNRILYTGDTLQMALYRQFGVPWIRNDIHESLKTINLRLAAVTRVAYEAVREDSRKRRGLHTTNRRIGISIRKG